MAITTKFEIGDIAYSRDKAREGQLSPVTIVDIKGETSLNTSATVTYRTHGISSFIVTWYSEAELLTFSEAKTTALEYLEDERAEIEDQIGKVRGTFTPFPSFVNVI